MFWFLVKGLWLPYWPLILLLLAVIIVYEIITRFGSSHYNSANGFSPGFNRLVGSGAYILFQAITYFVLHLFIGDWIYCYLWSYAIHLVAFGLTGWFLRAVGFWVY